MKYIFYLNILYIILHINIKFIKYPKERQERIELHLQKLKKGKSISLALIVNTNYHLIFKHYYLIYNFQ